jgi:hypothetical protein
VPPMFIFSKKKVSPAISGHKFVKSQVLKKKSGLNTNPTSDRSLHYNPSAHCGRFE